NGTLSKDRSQGITKEDLSAALSGLKNEILNDLQMNTKPKGPIQVPVKPKQNLSTLFLNLGGK
ncbi:Clp protease ClpP, partial [Bacillus thuringiensis]|nr:Clp protease ClpP [Bacillus thuringiensis]